MPKFLHEILSDILNGMSFVIDFKTAVDNLDGTFTLTEICNFHHAQPVNPDAESLYVTIGGKRYTVDNYDYAAKTLIVRGTDPILVTSFVLYNPVFFHGTPMAQQAELTKIPLSGKTPMIYLMEPYKTENDYSEDTAIGKKYNFTLCFLTQADTPKWLTDDFYHNAIHPMNNLMEDFIEELRQSPLFYTVEQKADPKFYTKFGITITQSGTKELLFSENLSGVGVDLRLELYKEDCEVC